MASDRGLIVRLLSGNAERWRRRAWFYERHRDYFPRLSSGRFVARCRELEAMYRKLSMVLEKLSFEAGWAWRASIVRRTVAAFAPEDHILPVPISPPPLRKRRIKH